MISELKRTRNGWQVVLSIGDHEFNRKVEERDIQAIKAKAYRRTVRAIETINNGHEEQS